MSLRACTDSFQAAHAHNVELIAKCVTKNDSQDVCFNGYPITDTTDQWSPIFEYQHVYIIFPPNCTSYDHVMPKCALCTPQVHHMDCRIALPTPLVPKSALCTPQVHHMEWDCTSYDHVVPKSALCTPQVHHMTVGCSYDHVVPKSCTPQVPTWTVGLHFLRPRGAKKCSMYTTGAPHGL